jgi:hypothetical protein
LGVGLNCAGGLQVGRAQQEPGVQSGIRAIHGQPDASRRAGESAKANKPRSACQRWGDEGGDAGKPAFVEASLHVGREWMVYMQAGKGVSGYNARQAEG